MLEKDDSSVNFPDNQHEDGHSIAAKQIQRLCPSVDATSLQDKGKSPNISNASIGRFMDIEANECWLIFLPFIGFDQHEDLLLIVTFYRKEYDSIPLLEILYRPHFKVTMKD